MWCGGVGHGREAGGDRSRERSLYVRNFTLWLGLLIVLGITLAVLAAHYPEPVRTPLHARRVCDRSRASPHHRPCDDDCAFP